MIGSKQPRKSDGFSWCRREFADGALSYTLFRRDEIRRVYQRSISFGPDSSRKRMRQPRKDVLRENLAAAADTIERLRAENERLRAPWWRRIFTRKAA